MVPKVIEPAPSGGSGLVADDPQTRQESDSLPLALALSVAFVSASKGPTISFNGQRTIAVIQARMTSERLPGKVLRPLGGRSVLGWVVRAAQESGAVDEVVVATSTDSTDDEIDEAATAMGAKVVRGPMDDVLERFVMAIELFEPDSVVRLTADNPLLDPAIVRLATRAFHPADLDYLSTGRVRTLPLGLGVEVCSAAALMSVSEVATGADRVHVTSYLYREPGRFRIAGLVLEPRGDQYRLTMDTPEDAALLEALTDHLGDSTHAFADLIDFLDRHPEIALLNQGVKQKSLEEG